MTGSNQPNNPPNVTTAPFDEEDFCKASENNIRQQRIAALHDHFNASWDRCNLSKDLYERRSHAIARAWTFSERRSNSASLHPKTKTTIEIKNETQDKHSSSMRATNATSRSGHDITRPRSSISSVWNTNVRPRTVWTLVWSTLAAL